MKRSDQQYLIIIHPTYAIFVIGVTILSLANSMIFFLPLNPEVKGVAIIVDGFISMFLLADFFFALYRSLNKPRFMFKFYGWMSFVGSLPLPFVRVFRLLYYVLAVRKLRRSDYAGMGKIVIQERAQTTFALTILVAIMVLELGGMFILRAEMSAPNANIHTASDALWWGYVTVATVGYGDKYPVTNWGRIVGILEMTVGVGLFSVLTGFLSDWFRRPRKAFQRAKVSVEMPVAEDPKARLSEIRRQLEEHERIVQDNITELKTQLAEIEQLLS